MVITMKLKTINFERTTGKALYLQIYEKLRSDILSGYLVKGDQLPSIRKCEALMKVSKTSIERAYEKLLEEGYILSVPQKGFFVDVEPENVQLRKAVLAQGAALQDEKIRYDFRSQTMDVSSFDLTLWKKYLKEVLDGHYEIATYGEARGELRLRMALQKYAYTVRGVLCTSNQLLIGSSFQSLLYVLCGLLDKPVVIGLEESGFPQAEAVFHDYAFPVRRLSREADGICKQELLASDVNLLYVNSASAGYNHQPLDKKKRRELLAWAAQRNAMIIEDDHNGELRYHTRMTPAMQGFDTGGHVVYIGSFSKILLPSLRISYMVIPQALQHRYDQRANSYSPTSSKIEQLALARYIADGHLERHVRRLRRHYEQKSSHMRTLLEQWFPQADILLEEAALQFILRFPYLLPLESLIQEARKHSMMLQRNAQGELVLSFAAIKMEDMEEAVRLLHSLLEAATGRNH